jgi:hypothetical protein
MHYFFTLLRHHAATCFRPVCSPSSAVLNEKEIVPSHPGPPTVALKLKQVPFATLYTPPPVDGLQTGPKRV